MGMIDGQEVVYDWYYLARGNFTDDTLPLDFGETSSFLPHLLNLMSVSFFGLGGKCTAAMSTTLHVHVQIIFTVSGCSSTFLWKFSSSYCSCYSLITIGRNEIFCLEA